MSEHNAQTPTEGTTRTPQPGEAIRAKWVMDGSSTLGEAAERLEEFAAWLRTQHEAGWTLAAPVEDDYGFLVSPDGDAGESASEDAGVASRN